MTSLNNKIDFAGVISCTRCNPNGDPTNGNLPRQDYDGHGFISDVCLKRKIRDRLHEMGNSILVENNDYVKDGLYSIEARVKSQKELMELIKEDDGDGFRAYACKKWIDVRMFGQTFAFKSKPGNVTTGIRGPVSIQDAVSLEPIQIITKQITKSTNNIDSDTREKDSSTLALKYLMEKGAYVFYGSIFPKLAEMTGFTEEDALAFKNAMIHIFENDASASRPAGSMVLEKLFWWQHNNKHGQYSSARIHRSINFTPMEQYPYFKVEINNLPGIEPEILEGR